MKYFTFILLITILSQALGFENEAIDSTLSLRRQAFSAMFPAAYPGAPQEMEIERTTELLKNQKQISIRHETNKMLIDVAASNKIGAEDLVSASYTLEYDPSEHRFTQLHIYLMDSPDWGLVIHIFSENSKQYMNVLFDSKQWFYRIPLGLSVEQVFLSPFTHLMERTSMYVNWDHVLPTGNYNAYENIIALSKNIRSNLHHLPDAEDGAIDEYGNLVFIETSDIMEDLPGFNCSGFCKWVIDGMLYPSTGEYLAIEPLKESTYTGTQLSQPLAEMRDPYFGLDWTRNLGKSLYEIYDELPSSASIDVSDASIGDYQAHIGYSINTLSRVLYQLALKEPGNLYLGSVNKPFGTGPTLRQHVHVVVLMPYFDEQGLFHINVFERNVESSMQSLKNRYSSEFMHLVRIPAREAFSPWLPTSNNLQ